MPELLQKHIRACLSRTFFDGSDVEEENLREALARHAQCWEENEVNPSVAAAGVRKALVPRLEVTALDRVEGAWSSLEEYFALSASIERVFRGSRGRFKYGPAHIITAELVAGLNPPEFKTKVATVEQADKLHRVQSRPKGVVRVGSAKEGKKSGVGRGGQRSSARSGD